MELNHSCELMTFICCDIVLMNKTKMYVIDMLQFDALCCADLEARQRLMLPAIERLLRPACVQRACIVKLYHDEVLSDLYCSSLFAQAKTEVSPVSSL